MEPFSFTHLCRTTGDPHEVVDALRRGAKPDTTTLMTVCQRTVQVYQAWQHMLRHYNRQGDIRLNHTIFMNGMQRSLFLWTNVVEKLIALGATVDLSSMEVLEQSGIQELVQKVKQAHGPAKMKRTE